MTNALQKFFDNRNFKHGRGLNQLIHSLDNVFDNFGEDWDRSDFGFSPSCELTEESNNYIMKFDLPGVSKDQVKVEIDGNQITVSAERKEEKKSETKKKYFSEVKYGSYYRSFSMPSAVDEDQIKADFSNGVLTVTVPKSESPSAKQIPIG